MTSSEATDAVWPDATLVSRFSALATADISDADGRTKVMDGGVTAVWTGAHLAGRARTISIRPGGIGGVREALGRLGPGDVLVIDGRGDDRHALIGEQMALRAVRRGAVGIIADGAVRDVARLQELGIPVFARAISPRRGSDDDKGRFDVEVVVGGVVVHPGDIVVGDADGVVVVPAISAAATASAAEIVRDTQPEQHLLD